MKLSLLVSFIKKKRMEYCRKCNLNESFKNGLCIICSNYYLVEPKSNITKQREIDILLHSSPDFYCKCHNFKKSNDIISRICMIETTLTKLLSELTNLKKMISEFTEL